MSIDKPLNMKSSPISRPIIDNNNMIIFIILIEYALKIELIPKIPDIIVTRYNYTKR